MYLPNNTLLQGGKYRIDSFIGSGGFGCTYKATHIMLNRIVAIKEFFVKDFCNRDEATHSVTVGTQTKVELVAKLKKKFIDEATSLASLRHPNIVSVSDIFEENGTAYFVMDYIDGKSLSEIISEKGTLAEVVAVKYIKQVCDALSCVHSHNRLHLDIKPANIMIGNDGMATLIDFGASKQYDEVNGENTSTLIGKTPGYAPIEQLGNNVQNFTPATDIYSLGATLYKCLTGNTPSDATAIVSDGLPSLPAYLSPEIARAIESAMQVNKTKRPQSITEFVAMLNGASSASAVVSPQKQTAKQGAQSEETIVVGSGKQTQTTIRNNKAKVNEKTVWIVGTFLVLLLWIVCSNIERNKIELKDESQKEQKNIVESTGTHNGHQWVDLGLPSGTKWAICNVGATNPEEYGNYYAWGETNTKNTYTKKNSKWTGVGYSSLKSKSVIDSKGNLTEQCDVAQAKWGGDWRMPTKDEIEELLKLTNKDTIINGVKGRNFYGNGNTLFLPFAGCRYEDECYYADVDGYYWSATAYENVWLAYYLWVYSGIPHKYGCNRYWGCTVRPVLKTK